MPHRFRAPASLLLAAHVVLVGGCHSYQPITTFGGLDDRGSSRVLQVTRRDGDTFLLRGAYVATDSLFGTDANRLGARRAIALSDISALSQSEFSVAETAQVVFLVTAGAALTVLVAVLVLMAGDRRS